MERLILVMTVVLIAFGCRSGSRVGRGDYDVALMPRSFELWMTNTIILAKDEVLYREAASVSQVFDTVKRTINATVLVDGVEQFCTATAEKNVYSDNFVPFAFSDEDFASFEKLGALVERMGKADTSIGPSAEGRGVQWRRVRRLDSGGHEFLEIIGSVDFPSGELRYGIVRRGLMRN